MTRQLSRLERLERDTILRWGQAVEHWLITVHGESPQAVRAWRHSLERRSGWQPAPYATDGDVVDIEPQVRAAALSVGVDPDAAVEEARRLIDQLTSAGLLTWAGRT